LRGCSEGSRFWGVEPCHRPRLLRGNICWKAPAGGKVRIYDDSNLFGSGAVVWEVGA